MRTFKIEQGTQINIAGESITFATMGGYKVILPAGERRVIRNNEKLFPFFKEMLSLALRAESRKGGNLEMIFKDEPSKWLNFFKATARHGSNISTIQVWAFLAVIRVEKFEVCGVRAYELIKALYRLTPGGNSSANKGGFPIPTEEELEKIKVIKEFDADFQKTTVRLYLPSDEMVARMFGKESRNIKHLGEVFAGQTDVHFHIVPVVKPADETTLI